MIGMKRREFITLLVARPRRGRSRRARSGSGKRPSGKKRTQLTERFLRQASLLRELQLPITGHSQVEGNKNRILDSRNKEPAPRHREGSTRGRFRRIRRFGFFGSLVSTAPVLQNLARLKFDVQLDHPVPAFADKEHFGSGMPLRKRMSPARCLRFFM